jgi:hypothetical protein
LLDPTDFGGDSVYRAEFSRCAAEMEFYRPGDPMPLFPDYLGQYHWAFGCIPEQRDAALADSASERAPAAGCRSALVDSAPT